MSVPVPRMRAEIRKHALFEARLDTTLDIIGAESKTVLERIRELGRGETRDVRAVLQELPELSRRANRILRLLECQEVLHEAEKEAREQA